MQPLRCAVLGSLLFLLAAGAAAQDSIRVRATIVSLEGDALVVKTREGRELRVALTDKTTVAAAKAITLADLKPGDYVGSATRRRADGTLVALEVHTLPRSVAEGHRPWDLEPGSMMTNAQIAAVAESEGGHELTLVYRGGTQKILVPPGTPIVTTIPADRSFLKPGEYVFFTAQGEPGGGLTVPGRIQVSRDGVRPPQ
ncbi:MAG TPA: hypothetical protein VNK67_13185 [Burkholderiales bacterium]|nr:hypothetical protein [Burkholderiales bacterium]